MWFFTMAASIVALGILVATREAPVAASWGFRGASEAFAIVCGTVGVVVGMRRSENINGWLFAAIGLLFATEAVLNEYVIAGALVVPGGLPWTMALSWPLTWLWVPSLGIALILLPLLFPTGRLPSPAWRPAIAFGALAIGAFSLAMAFQPGPNQQATYLDNPLGFSGLAPDAYARVLVAVAGLPFIASIAAALASLVRRFRRAQPEARQQIKWFALAALVAGVAFTLYAAASAAGGSATGTKVLEILVVVALMMLPTAAGIAILRYRLYDIDRIVSRTISYAIVTALLVATFVIVNLGLQSVLSGVLANDAGAVAVTTLVVATLFTPLRRRVQRAVDGRFDRARYDAERTTVAFSEHVREEVDLSTLVGELDATVAQAMAPTSVGVWLRSGNQ